MPSVLKVSKELEQQLLKFEALAFDINGKCDTIKVLEVILDLLYRTMNRNSDSLFFSCQTSIANSNKCNQKLKLELEFCSG